MTELIELPELVILLISKELSYEDLQSLRVTCKKLKAIVDQRTPQSLHLFVNCYPFERELLHTGELVRYANTFHGRRLEILKSTKFKNQFNGLRKLIIYNIGPRYGEVMNLNDLNCFEGLVHLQLERVSIGDGKLNLRNLKIALLENQSHDITNFELDCPQLHVLGLVYQTRPKLNQETASSVRYLYLHDGADTETSLFLLLAKFDSLFTICFCSHHGSELLNRFVVALIERRVSLPSLKQIQLERQWYFPERGVLLRNLAKLKSRQETKHLEVQINGKMMDSDEFTKLFDLLNKILSVTPDNPEDPEDPLNHIDQGLSFGNLNSDLLRHFSENPALHCLLPGVDALVLESDEDVRISKQLIARLRSIQKLVIEIAVDDQYLECILKSCRRISNLQIFDHSSQQQLDQMPDYQQNLGILTFGVGFEKRNFTFHFVSKFRNLVIVSFKFNIPKETMSFLFENIKHTRFRMNLFGMQRRISIHCWRNENGRFEIRCYEVDALGICGSPKITEFDCIEEAIEYYYRNDLFNTSAEHS